MLRPAAGACVPNGNTTLPDRTTVAVCRPALRAVPAAHAGDRAGAFYLSWVADGVAGAAPETQDGAADVRVLAKVWYPQLAVPAATLAPGGRLTATLGEPDALHVEIVLPARGWVAVTAGGATGLPTERTDMLLMRVR